MDQEAVGAAAADGAAEVGRVAVQAPLALCHFQKLFRDEPVQQHMARVLETCKPSHKDSCSLVGRRAGVSAKRFTGRGECTQEPVFAVVRDVILIDTFCALCLCK